MPLPDRAISCKSCQNKERISYMPTQTLNFILLVSIAFPLRAATRSHVPRERTHDLPRIPSRRHQRAFASLKLLMMNMWRNSSSPMQRSCRDSHSTVSRKLTGHTRFQGSLAQVAARYIREKKWRPLCSSSSTVSSYRHSLSQTNRKWVQPPWSTLR